MNTKNDLKHEKIDYHHDAYEDDKDSYIHNINFAKGIYQLIEKFIDLLKLENGNTFELKK